MPEGEVEAIARVRARNSARLWIVMDWVCSARVHEQDSTGCRRASVKGERVVGVQRHNGPEVEALAGGVLVRAFDHQVLCILHAMNCQS